MKSKWTKHKIITQILRLHKEGIKPSIKNIISFYPGLYYAGKKRFGSWKKAVIAAGLDYSKISNQLVKNLWSKKRISAEIKNIHNRGEPLNSSYICRNYIWLYRAATNKTFFGTWEDAIESTGLNYDKIRLTHPRMTEEEVIKKLYQMSKKGEVITRKSCSTLLFDSIVSHFGTLNNCKTTLGLPTIKFHSLKKPLPESAKKPSPEMGYVIGAILGDGCVENEKNTHPYRLSLKVKDKDFIIFFAKQFEKWVRYKITIFPISSKGQWGVQASQKETSQLLLKYKKNPLLCLNFPISVQNKLLKGLFDAEGYIRPSRKNALRITITNKDDKIISIIKQILTNNNITFSVEQREIRTGGKIKRIRIDKMVDVFKFIRIIDGITIQRKYKKVKNRIKKASKLKEKYCEIMQLSKQGVSRKEIWEKVKRKTPICSIRTMDSWIHHRQLPFVISNRN